MKAIMISIKPKWCALMMNGDKTIEVRKTCPKIFKRLKPYEGCSIDVYIYCTKSKYEMGKFNSDKKYHEIRDDCCYAGGWLRGLPDETVNGKVVAKFTLNKVEEIEIVYSQENELGGYSESYGTKTLSTNELLNKSQLDYFELAKYLKDYTPFGYAWHISNLEIFDKPKELSEFWIRYPKEDIKFEGVKGKLLAMKPLTKAPQSWCYVEVEK